MEKECKSIERIGKMNERNKRGKDGMKVLNRIEERKGKSKESS